MWQRASAAITAISGGLIRSDPRLKSRLRESGFQLRDCARTRERAEGLFSDRVNRRGRAVSAAGVGFCLRVLSPASGKSNEKILRKSVIDLCCI